MAQRAGLGDEFVACLEAVLSTAAQAPNAFPMSVGEVRRGLVRRFPYGVFYILDGEAIVVLAVAHARRRPGYLSGCRVNLSICAVISLRDTHRSIRRGDTE